MPARVRVGCVWLPAAELAQALQVYATGRLMDERRARAGGRAFAALPWLQAVEDLRAGAQVPHANVPGPAYLTTLEASTVVGRDPATIRRWAASGRIPGARRGPGGCWCIPEDFDPPADGRRKRDHRD